MSKRSSAIDHISSCARANLVRLGEHVAISRKRRMESIRVWQDATLENVLSAAASYKLTGPRAPQIVREVAGAVDGWKTHFKVCGVSARDVDHLSQQIDRPFLADPDQH